MDEDQFESKKTTLIKKKIQTHNRKRTLIMFRIKPRYLNLYLSTQSNVKVEMTKLMNNRRDTIMDLLELFCKDHLYIHLYLKFQLSSATSEDYLIREILHMLSRERLVKTEARALFEWFMQECHIKPPIPNRLNFDEKRAYFVVKNCLFYYW